MADTALDTHEPHCRYGSEFLEVNNEIKFEVTPLDESKFEC